MTRPRATRPRASRPRALRCCVVLLALLLAGCAARGAGSPAAPDVLGEWELTGGTSAGVPLPRPAAGRATLLLEDGQLGGVSFCNHYSATYRLDGDAFGVDVIGGTEMGCEPDVMAAESAYLAALAAVDEARVEGEDLLLTGDDVELRFEPVPPVPTSALVGTGWVLETVLEGDLASSTVGAPATLRLGDDGTMTGSTGCRTLTGTWEIRGGTVVLPELGADGECPDDVRAQDDHVVAVLGDGFRADVVEDRLTLSDPGGRGLVYRAVP